MDELHQQTVNLLSFQPLPKDVFDAQVAFNMLARYGQKSQPTLDSVEARILRHFHENCAARMRRNLRFFCCRRPFFTATLRPCSWKWKRRSTWQYFSQVAGWRSRRNSRRRRRGAPSNVSSAGQADIQLALKAGSGAAQRRLVVGGVRTIYGVSAITAVECAESMTATRPTGKIQ